MRSADPAFITALSEGPSKGIKPRRFLWVRAKTRDPVPVPFDLGVWTGDRDITVSLKDGITGATVSRIYYGMGRKLVMPTLSRVSDLTIQTPTVKMSQLSNVTQTLVRENNVRFAKVDVHEALLHTRTKLLVSAPELVFIGEVDGDPIETPKAGGTGAITLEMVSDAIRLLTETNPATRSYQTYNQRSGDQFGKWSNIVGNFEYSWGEASSANPGSAPAPSPNPGGKK